MRLGKLPPRPDARTLKLGAYFAPSLPPAPPSVDWGATVPSWPMMLNDRIGDCTCAAAAHQIQAWTQADLGRAVTLSDADVLAAYEEVSGYDPASGANDNGAVELDVLKLWRKPGIGGHRIGAFAEVRTDAPEHIRQAVWLFGGAYIGVALPLTAQGQAVWDVTDPSLRGDAAFGSWGGHAVNVVAYDAEGLTVITWGEPKRMTWAFWNAYVDEAWALLSPDWLGPDAKAPVGFDLAALQADLAQVGAVQPPEKVSLMEQVNMEVQAVIAAIAAALHALLETDAAKDLAERIEAELIRAGLRAAPGALWRAITSVSTPDPGPRDAEGNPTPALGTPLAQTLADVELEPGP